MRWPELVVRSQTLFSIERTMKLLKSKYLLYYLIFLILMTISILYLVNEWMCLDDKRRYARYKPVSKHEKRKVLIGNYAPFCGPYSLSLDEVALDSRNSRNLSSNKSACTLATVSKSGCDNILATYYQTVPIQKCRAESYELCRAEDSDGKAMLSLKCNFDQCRKAVNISVGILDPATGLLLWHNYANGNVTDRSIRDLATSTLVHKHPFMFIQCTRDVDSELITQLLVLPYHYTSPSQNSHNQPPVHPVNINMILVDSVSRQHFYRMLPDTVRYLQKLRTSEKLEVLDFEFFHSVKGRTYENLKSLFEGEVHEIGEEFEGLSTPPTAVDFHALFGEFKRLGYTTLYQEDLCWEYDWGLIKDTGIYRLNLPKNVRFSSFSHALTESGIDNIGMTHSVCEIFRRFRIIDAFNYLGNLCFSGEFIHDYFLRYSMQALRAHVDSPLFSFLILNVGHEGTGRRIRTLDESLLKFLTSASHLKNTIHVLFSDHGNSYGSFSRSLEGHLETFHPFMFMLIPNSIAALLGRGTMQNLKGNQKTLITTLDLHFTLKELLNQISEEQAISHLSSNLGLFGPIAARNCNDLQLHQGTLCFCDGWKSSLPTVSVHLLIGEFVLSKVNRRIHRSQQKWPDISGHCQRLIGIAISNVWQKIEKSKVQMGLDIKVQDDNLFSTTVSFTIDVPRSFEMRIDSMQRISSFGIYKVCANSHVPLEFCVCSRHHPYNSTISEIHSFPNCSVFSVNTESRKIHNDCLQLHTRSYTVGAVFEAFNSCFNVSYLVKLNFELDNMKLATNSYNRVVSPGSIAHLAIIIMDQSGIPWSYTYTVDISWKRINKDNRVMHRFS